MWTATFWKAAGERSIKTFAQASVAFLTAEATGILDVDWGQGASVAGLAALVSLLTSVASSGVGSPGPGLGSAETLTTDMVEL
jgi:hypothetical protein